MPITTPALAPDLWTRLLSLPHAALGAEASEPIAVSAGLPAGAFLIESANVILSATPCDQPMFSDMMERVARSRRRDVLLMRTGFHPEILNPVQACVALVAERDVLMLEGMAFYRHDDQSLWLVPIDAGPFIAIEPRGLRLEMIPPFLTYDQRVDGLCRAAAEIVRISTRQRSR
ncbi:hypothetical protein ACSBM8_12385 [Sphingomonas sp. ASY06-1R]|uniref:hypothetical protein n=1 Tax=Sphingomonas sp. ASY06-1R TaxID=3445771 RepID=UPI003FA2F34E